MTQPPFNYEVFNRADWARLINDEPHQEVSHITTETLMTIKAFNDQISMADVTMVYDPLVHYIQLRYEQYIRDLQERQAFLGRAVHPTPFVIGIAGSVAVGKTTTARLLQLMLQVAYGHDEVALTTTDGFLMSNDRLKELGLYNRKGFPESYDMAGLLKFMGDIKDGASEVKSPVYSHDVSDVLPGTFESFKRPKIFIIEGINTLQAGQNSLVYLSDFFDLSIYVDADTDLISHWYLDRFAALLNQTAQLNDPENFFYHWTQIPFEEAVNAAKNVWQTVNLPNLEDYILPTRERADLILHKTVGHVINQIWLRKS
jgi:type I pantothenate kinase